MNRRLLIAAVATFCCGTFSAQGLATDSATRKLEFLLTYGKVISLTLPVAELSLTTKFELDAIKAALPGYEITFETDAPMADSTEPAFAVSRNGQQFLWVYGEPNTQAIYSINGVAGVIDPSGATIGSPLKKAYRNDKVTCISFEGVTCWAEKPGINYQVSGPEQCAVDAGLSENAQEMNIKDLPDCAMIDVISTFAP